MFVRSVTAIVLALSAVVLATGTPRYTQFAFKFQSSANCQACSVENTTCFRGILDCVQMSYNTHNATVVKQITNATEMWMLLVLQLCPNAKVDGSQFVDGCASNMTDWKFWNYAECTMDISGVGGYYNCSLTKFPADSNPSMSLPAWVYVVPVVVAGILALVSIILAVVCYKMYIKDCFARIRGRGYDQLNANPADFNSVGANYSNPTPAAMRGTT